MGIGYTLSSLGEFDVERVVGKTMITDKPLVQNLDASDREQIKAGELSDTVD